MRRIPHRLNKNSEFYDKRGQLKEGYSFEGGAGMVARGEVETNIRTGAGKDGLSYKKGSRTVYSREAKPAPAAASAPAPAPPPKPVEKKTEAGSFQVSPDIQQAKARVNAYENKSSTAWNQAQATVQRSFIKPADSSTDSKQYDFASKSFDQNESLEPNEQSQAAQYKVQNYISKYSRSKSITN
jgi:hypothetical protein